MKGRERRGQLWNGFAGYELDLGRLRGESQERAGCDMSLLRHADRVDGERWRA